jgi:hypothetical protein
VQDAGAGSSLVATALFNAEFAAGLKDVEHHPHASLTDRFPAGMEAAVSYPDVDMKFQDDSGAPVYVWTQSTDTAVTVAILGRKGFDAVQSEISPRYAVVAPKAVAKGTAAGCVAQDGVAGFQIDVTRVMSKAGQEPVRQVFHTVYAPVDRIVCGSAAAASQGSTVGGPSAGAGPGSATGTKGGGPSPTSGPSPGGGGGGTSSPTGGSSPSGSPTTDEGGLLGGLLGGGGGQPRR